ncbi:LacI family DNA-binding transcriptional regulator [Sinorhizobium numidicum]|uniref:LacI family DNA-binding transcriptional regulator n=1 Tax=Sinorhizobium numidicum TaxID=680248 RepID=A0ABY8CQN5_9HYPH|nr:LacI family DNA-binding transcriptional regulator [Sinorhizobium numidicum]WEX74964.1 LacI family DNA-binding transcriptional regulator [Sinorhizobium numidicum]WEX80958.1 LacI family DNA-binding transcriptional regulator [Sinorhizobium numidicum]
MSDVSRLAGVSKMTVSRVLADPELVSEATRTRVMKAIDQLGYVPDRIAGSLSSRRTNFVTAILPTLTNANFADTAQGLAGALRAADYQLLIGYTMYSLKEEELIVRAMLARRPDAIVIAGTVHTKAANEMLLRAGIPIVEIWDVPEHPIDHAVGFSNYEVGRLAARHLISLGHRRIAALGSRIDGDAMDLRGEARLQGFAAVLREAGIADDLVIREGSAPVSYDHGARTLATLLQRAPDVEAVFAVSDISAVGALMECHRRGIKVPEALSLIGFGDFDIARQCVPAISTIRVDAAMIGRKTGELLLSILERDNASAPITQSRIDIGFDLLIRETTAPREPG